MIIFKTAADLIRFLQDLRNKGNKINFIPTMGALHQGHISLIDSAKEKNTVTVASIFINPTQFNNPLDFEKYPVTIENDILQLEKLSCDVLFLPSVSEMYPDGPVPTTYYMIGELENILEGKYRPGHFQGVCQIVHRLLSIVQPDKLFLGQKDYQQVMVLKKLVSLLNIRLEITVCPTLRESDGLAMSSRNMRLGKEDRVTAAAIFTAMSALKNEIKPGKVTAAKEKAVRELQSVGFTVDYVEIADADSLQLLTDWDGKTKIIVLTAAYLNDIRLIDNLAIN